MIAKLQNILLTTLVVIGWALIIASLIASIELFENIAKNVKESNTDGDSISATTLQLEIVENSDMNRAKARKSALVLTDMDFHFYGDTFPIFFNKVTRDFVTIEEGVVKVLPSPINNALFDKCINNR